MTKRKIDIDSVLHTSAAIAQLVEHFIRNEKVPGSSPGRGSSEWFSTTPFFI